MEIRIRKQGGPATDIDPDASGVSNTYRVIDNGKEFFITVRSHAYGSVLGIGGQEGVLYTDRDSNTVYKHVLAVGDGCGVRVESDALVEELSAWSIRGVVLADRRGETREIVLTTGQSDSSNKQLVVLIDDEVTELGKYL